MGKKTLSMKDREMKQVTKCFRRRLAWCNATGQRHDPSIEQYSIAGDESQPTTTNSGTSGASTSVALWTGICHSDNSEHLQEFIYKISYTMH